MYSVSKKSIYLLLTILFINNFKNTLADHEANHKPEKTVSKKVPKDSLIEYKEESEIFVPKINCDKNLCVRKCCGQNEVFSNVAFTCISSNLDIRSRISSFVPVNSDEEVSQVLDEATNELTVTVKKKGKIISRKNVEVILGWPHCEYYGPIEHGAFVTNGEIWANDSSAFIPKDNYCADVSVNEGKSIILFYIYKIVSI